MGLEMAEDRRGRKYLENGPWMGTTKPSFEATMAAPFCRQKTPEGLRGPEPQRP